MTYFFQRLPPLQSARGEREEEEETVPAGHNNNDHALIVTNDLLRVETNEINMAVEKGRIIKRQNDRTFWAISAAISTN